MVCIMKIISLISDFVSLSLTDFTNYKKTMREKIKTFVITFLILLFSFIIADHINQTKNDFITFIIAFPIILVVDGIIIIIKNKKL